MSYSYLFKYIIIGDSSVGKSAILLQFMEGKFKAEHDTTIGVEFGSKIIQVKGKNVKLQVWDTAGQESFKSITRSYYRGSICAFLVYDVTNRESFTNIQKWLEETQNYANDKITLVLVGNKIDLANKRQVSYDEGHEFAQKQDIQFVETSAKMGQNIDQVFRKSTEDILQKIENRQVDATNESLGIKIGPQLTEKMVSDTKKTKKECC
ncbi:hypothetical protein ABPG74_020383 [Tetrahymena malaccensis]